MTPTTTDLALAEHTRAHAEQQKRARETEALRLLHAALELTTFHLKHCYQTGDSATRQILNENEALIGLTREIAGR